MINIFQPCVTFNKQTTYSWYKEKIYKLDNNYDSSDFNLALNKSLETEDRIPIGLIYQTTRATYTDNLPQISKNILVEAKPENNIESLIDEFI